MAVLPDPITLAEQRQYTRSTRSWAFATFLVTTIVGVAGMLGVIGRGVLAGGALLDDDSSFGDLVSMAASGWLPSGSGSPGQVDALWLVLSPLVAISQPLGGSLGSVATAVILLALPLAGLAAYRAAGTFTLSPLLRFVAGLLWAFAPPLLGSIQAGQVAGVIWHILAPLGVSLLVRCWRGNSISLVARASLVLAVMSAAAPLTIVLVIGVIAAAVIRRAWRWLWIPVPALVLDGANLHRGRQLARSVRRAGRSRGRPALRPECPHAQPCRFQRSQPICRHRNRRNRASWRACSGAPPPLRVDPVGVG